MMSDAAHFLKHLEEKHVSSGFLILIRKLFSDFEPILSPCLKNKERDFPS
jgi:hypothetical protein